MRNLTPTANPPQAAENAATRGRAHALLTLVERIGETVEAETTAIRGDPKFDIKASNARKSRHLYELGRAFKSVEPDDLGPEHRQALLRLRERLSVNEEAIRAQLNAVSEVATLLQNAIEHAQADGTYSVREFGQR